MSRDASGWHNQMVVAIGILQMEPTVLLAHLWTKGHPAEMSVVLQRL